MADQQGRVASQVCGSKRQCHELTIAATGGRGLCQPFPSVAMGFVNVTIATAGWVSHFDGQLLGAIVSMKAKSRVPFDVHTGPSVFV